MLKISKLDKIYKSKSGEKFQALSDIDLNFGHKGFVFILGKSGSGKSTLLNIIGGLDNFTRGDIEIKGKSSKDFKAKDWDSYRNTYVGFVFQEFHIIENYSIGKNIALALELQGTKGKDIKPRVKEILKQVGLEKYSDRNPNELSGGQRQRIAIARALVKNPQIILADEPTGNLDEETGTQIVDILRQLAEEKLVIMVTHDKSNAYKYSDRIITMSDGQIHSDEYNEGGLKYISEEIENYRTEGELTNVIRIPKGKSIDTEKAKEINRILASGAGDIYIPLSKNKQLTGRDFGALNNVIKKFGDVAFLPIARNIGKIQGTKNKKNKDRVNPAQESLGKETSPFKLINSNFPMGNTIGMALSAIWRKKFKLFFSSIVFLLALGLFGFSETVTKFDFPKAVTNSYVLGNINEVPLLNREDVLGWGNEFGGSSKAIMPFQLNEIINIMSKYPQFTYGRIYDFPNKDITISSESDLVTPKKLKGFLELGQISDIDIQIIEGTFPKSYDEIMLTDFLADYLVEQDADLTTSADLIDTYYTIEERDYKIVGIADTDYESHLFLNDIPASELKDRTAEVANYSSSHDSKYSRIIVKQGFYAENYKEVNVFANTYSVQIPRTDAKDDWDTDWLANAFVTMSDDMINHPKRDHFLFVPDNFTGLKADEILISPDSLANLNQMDDSMSIYNMINAEVNEQNADVFAKLTAESLIPTEPIESSIVSEQDFARIDKKEFKIVGVIDFWRYSQIYNTEYMYDYVLDNGGSFSSMDLQEFERNEGHYEHRVKTEYIRVKLRENGVSTPAEESFNHEQYGDYFSYLNGLAKDYEITEVNFFPQVHSPVVMEKQVYDELNPYHYNKVSGILVSLPSDTAITQEFFETTHSMGYHHNTLSGIVLGGFDDFVEEAAHIFRYVSLALAGFSTLLMFTNISGSVLAAKKEIGTLRAIGAKGSDVAMIFVTEALFIASFVSILANIALVIVTQMLNSDLTDQTGIPLSIFNPSPIIGVELILLAFAVGGIAAFLPARRVTLMKPIDAILNK